MANILLYKVCEYTEEYKKVFRGVYEDFRSKSFTDYKFELEPLQYDDFISSLDEGLIKCLILLEDEVPTAFMVYTTEISEALELNLIHCLGDEEINLKRKLLMEKYLELNKDLLSEKVTIYPMLGSQAGFVEEITNYGFKLVGLAVVRFLFSNNSSKNIFRAYTPKALPSGYKITKWKDSYKNSSINIINDAFKHESDALFDTRFLSKEGCKDIIDKITAGIYGEFLPDCTSVLLYKNEPAGICFANITGGKIGNIPLIGILHKHRYKGFGELLLHNTLKNALDNYSETLTELNASTETDNYTAIKMYRRLGFKEDYCYPQAYRPVEQKN